MQLNKPGYSIHIISGMTHCDFATLRKLKIFSSFLPAMTVRAREAAFTNIIEYEMIVPKYSGYETVVRLKQEFYGKKTKTNA